MIEAKIYYDEYIDPYVISNEMQKLPSIIRHMYFTENEGNIEKIRVENEKLRKINEELSEKIGEESENFSGFERGFKEKMEKLEKV